MNIGEQLSGIFERPLYVDGGMNITIGVALIALATLVGSWFIAKLVDRGMHRAIAMRMPDSPQSFAAARRVVRYLIVAVGIVVALEVVGVHISSLFTAGAIFAVGIGFAMQNIAQNFVSGIILMVERTIKTGDVLEVEGRRVRIESMGIRATIARSPDDQELIIPNSSLVQSIVANQSLTDPLLRLTCTVGVHYDSDMAKVREVLTQVGGQSRFFNKSRPAQILMVEFGDSSVVWELSVWIDAPWNARTRKSEIYEAVWFALKEAGVVIAYPQLDVHLPSKAAG